MESKGQRTRQRIVAEAAAVFNQRGFSGASLAELCERTNLQKGGLYRHFASKEELAVEAFEHAARLASKARFGDGSAATPLDRLYAIIDGFVKPRGELVPGGCPILNAAVDADDGNPVLRACVERALDSWLGRLSENVRLAVAAGELRSDTDPDALAVRIVSSLEGAILISRVQRSTRALELVAGQLREYLDSLR